MRGLLSASASARAQGGREGVCRLDSCVAADNDDVHYNNALPRVRPLSQDVCAPMFNRSLISVTTCLI